MANKKGKRRFGNVRKLPSGRLQASYIGPDGLRVVAPRTFEEPKQAEDWLILREADLLRGEGPPARKGDVPFGPYADEWIAERSGLRPRTADLYRWLLRRYLLPTFEWMYIANVDPAAVRRWRAKLLRDGVSATMVAKAYRLLRAIMTTAVDDDELIPRNPCRIKGAGAEQPEERPVLTVAQVHALADRMPSRLRALVLLTTFASLRFGEVSALQRRDINLEAGTVTVRQAYTEVRGRGLVIGPPKSRAGVRTVALPSRIIPDLRAHLDEYVNRGPRALVFTGPNGATLRRGNFNKLVRWSTVVAEVGVPGLHFHDLRHTGNTLAADAGVSTRNLMARMGHDSERAALIYQHRTAKADRIIAEALDAQLQDEHGDDEEGDDGTAGALVPTG